MSTVWGIDFHFWPGAALKYEFQQNTLDFFAFHRPHLFVAKWTANLKPKQKVWPPGSATTWVEGKIKIWPLIQHKCEKDTKKEECRASFKKVSPENPLLSIKVNISTVRNLNQTTRVTETHVKESWAYPVKWLYMVDGVWLKSMAKESKHARWSRSGSAKHGSCDCRGLAVDLPAAPQSPQFPLPGLSSSCLKRCPFLSRSEFMMRLFLPGCPLTWLGPFTSPASNVSQPLGAPDCRYLRWGVV